MAFTAPAIGSIRHVAHVVLHRDRPAGAMRHDRHVLALHRASGHYGLAGEWHRVAGGVLILLPAGDADDNRLIGRDTAWWCQFDGAAICSAPGGARFDLGDGVVEQARLRPLRVSEDRTAGAWFRELLAAWNLGTAAARLHCRARLFDLLGLWAGGEAAGDGAPARYRALIEQHACDPDLSLAELARRIGGDADALAAVFRRRLGLSPVQYRTRLRLQRARELLVHDPRPLGEIAAMCGLRDTGYLCRLFRQHLGTSPRAYARRCGRALPG